MKIFLSFTAKETSKLEGKQNHDDLGLSALESYGTFICMRISTDVTTTTSRLTISNLLKSQFTKYVNKIQLHIFQFGYEIC